MIKNIIFLYHIDTKKEKVEKILSENINEKRFLLLRMNIIKGLRYKYLMDLDKNFSTTNND